MMAFHHRLHQFELAVGSSGCRGRSSSLFMTPVYHIRRLQADPPGGCNQVASSCYPVVVARPTAS